MCSGFRYYKQLFYNTTIKYIIYSPYNEPYEMAQNIISYNDEIFGKLSGLFLINDTLEIRSIFTSDEINLFVSRFFTDN